MKTIAIIPARYGSTRFPGKSLARIGTMTLIQQVYTHAKKIPSLSDVIVATDDERIAHNIEEIGGKAIITLQDHTNGTERCSEILDRLPQKPDIVLNIQGDVPFVEEKQIQKLIDCFRKPEVKIATLCKKITDWETIQDPNTPKVIFNRNHQALYFSRSPVPYLRGVSREDWGQNFPYFKHIGIYGFRSAILNEVARLPKGLLESAESLEQLRWLENGYPIYVAETNKESLAIDSREDLIKAEQYLSR